MTREQLDIILANTDIAAVVKALQVSSYGNIIPEWSDLEEQYDPLQHAIFNTTLYPPKLGDNGQDDFKRTPLALQKLAVNRVAQSMFSTPVQRMYGEAEDNEQEKDAINLVEEVYRVRNSIDGSNIERAKQLLATCQVCTVWNVVEKPMTVGEEQSKYTLRHNIYSEMNGYKLYPIIDEAGDLLVMSIFYKDETGTDYMDTYINGYDTTKPQYFRFAKLDKWAIDQEAQQELEVFPVLYMYTREPVWGGEAGTALVEQLEEMESYQGLYIKRNTVPTFTIDYGEIEEGDLKEGDEDKETSNDSRRIIELGRGGEMKDVTWKGATEAIEARYKRIKNAFFEQIQVPDTSFANMIASNTSADNKELIFADARAKAEDIGGEWETMFYSELEIVKTMLGIMFSKYAQQLAKFSVRSKIKPYNVRNRLEVAEYIATAGNAMSLETKVGVLDEVDNVEAEVKRIEVEMGATNNMLGEE